ncbi:hypothetical protein [Anaeromyxobacter oryzisoli]|uniref:hypothetical protein n=1 Tax=Anaeromyxobacter oryzisoli TaxID=2925408 RepID=UPI001F5AFF51|nr:hypothetical protein [Anaeromyxobacter sp. SG63]
MTATSLDPRIPALLADAATVKILATSDRSGRPHATVAPSIHLDDDGRLVHLERLESSGTQRNLVASLWFDRPVAVTVQRGAEAFEIVGVPVKALVAGPEFRRQYEALRARAPEDDLAAVWLIEPREVTELTHDVRRARQEAERPFLTHLDRLAR